MIFLWVGAAIVLMLVGFALVFYDLAMMRASVLELNDNVCDLHEELVKAEVAQGVRTRVRGEKPSPVQERLIKRSAEAALREMERDGD